MAELAEDGLGLIDSAGEATGELSTLAKLFEDSAET